MGGSGQEERRQCLPVGVVTGDGGEARGHWCWRGGRQVGCQGGGGRAGAWRSRSGWGRGGEGVDSRGRVWGQEGDGMPGSGGRGGDLPQRWGPPSAPAPPAPGMRIYLCDNLMGCGSAVGGWLEGHLSSETCKFQHRAWLSRGAGRAPGAAGPASAGVPGTQTEKCPRGGRAGGRADSS